MQATNLHPDFFHLVAVTGEEEEALGHIFCFSPQGHAPDGESVGGACATLLAAVLTFGQYALDVVATPITVTRYAERPSTVSRPKTLTIAESLGETFTLAQIFGSRQHAQFVVDYAWQHIHFGNEPAELVAPALVLNA